jgi:alpha-galactosidase
MNGLYYRLTNPYKDAVGAWAFVSEDGNEVLVNAVMQEIHGNMTVNYIRLKGLISGKQYEEQTTKKVYSADALMEVGIPLPVETGEYKAYQYHFVGIN